MSLASGKTTASKILSKRYGPLFSADKAVKELYQNKKFKYQISKIWFKNNNQIKKSLRKLIIKDKSNLIKLEKIIHPLVRKNEKIYFKNKYKKTLFTKYHY